MNILDGNLESVEETGLGALDLGGKVAGEVFIDNTIGGGEEGKDVGDEVTFIVRETIPIFEVGGEVNFFGRPEGCFSFLIHLPYLYFVCRERFKGGG